MGHRLYWLFTLPFSAHPRCEVVLQYVAWLGRRQNNGFLRTGLMTFCFSCRLLAQWRRPQVRAVNTQSGHRASPCTKKTVFAVGESLCKDERNHKTGLIVLSSSDPRDCCCASQRNRRQRIWAAHAQQGGRLKRNIYARAIRST